MNWLPCQMACGASNRSWTCKPCWGRHCLPQKAFPRSKSLRCSPGRALAEQLDRPECLVPLISNQFWFHLVRAEYRPALALAEQLGQIGEARKAGLARFLGHLARGIIRLMFGEFIAARTALEACLRLADPAHRNM